LHIHSPVKFCVPQYLSKKDANIALRLIIRLLLCKVRFAINLLGVKAKLVRAHCAKNEAQKKGHSEEWPMIQSLLADVLELNTEQFWKNPAFEVRR
jgi:hypothetical protein